MRSVFLTDAAMGQVAALSSNLRISGRLSALTKRPTGAPGTVSDLTRLQTRTRTGVSECRPVERAGLLRHKNARTGSFEAEGACGNYIY